MFAAVFWLEFVILLWTIFLYSIHRILIYFLKLFDNINLAGHALAPELWAKYPVSAVISIQIRVVLGRKFCSNPPKDLCKALVSISFPSSVLLAAVSSSGVSVHICFHFFLGLLFTVGYPWIQLYHRRLVSSIRFI
jgi:hypothetical protein